MKRLNLVGLLLCIFAVSILAGCVTPILKSSSRTKQYSGRDTSWYGKSGALAAPVRDVNTTEETSNPTATAVKEGSWWIPDDSISVKGEGEIEVNVSDYPSARKVCFKIISR